MTRCCAIKIDGVGSVLVKTEFRGSKTFVQVCTYVSRQTPYQLLLTGFRDRRHWRPGANGAAQGLPLDRRVSDVVAAEEKEF